MASHATGDGNIPSRDAELSPRQYTTLSLSPSPQQIQDYSLPHSRIMGSQVLCTAGCALG